jgi:hypothetical protein
MQIWEFIQSAWLELVATGSLGFFAFKTFVFDKITQKKVFSIQEDSGKKWLERISALATKVVTIESEVQKLIGVVSNKDNELATKDLQIQQLANLVVQTLTVANVPLSQKENFFAGLNQVSVVGDKAMESLKLFIEHSKTIEAQKQISLSENIDKLKGV